MVMYPFCYMEIISKTLHNLEPLYMGFEGENRVDNGHFVKTCH